MGHSGQLLDNRWLEVKVGMPFEKKKHHVSTRRYHDLKQGRLKYPNRHVSKQLVIYLCDVCEEQTMPEGFR